MTQRPLRTASWAVEQCPLAHALPRSTCLQPAHLQPAQIHQDKLLSSIVVTFRSTYGNSAGW